MSAAKVSEHMEQLGYWLEGSRFYFKDIEMDLRKISVTVDNLNWHKNKFPHNFVEKGR